MGRERGRVRYAGKAEEKAEMTLGSAGWIARATLLVLCLTGIALSMTACQSGMHAGAFIDPAFRPLIPPDSQVLAGVRLEKLRSTDLYKKYRAELPLPMLEQFKEKTGIDPEQDIREALVVGSQAGAVVLVRGHFDPGELEPKLRALGTKPLEYKGHMLAGDERYAVAIVNRGVAAAGSAARLRALIDRRDQPVEIPVALTAGLAHVPGNAQLWVVGAGTIPHFGLLEEHDDIQSILENFVRYVNGAMLSLQVDSGLSFVGRVDCNSQEGVKRVNDALRGVIGLARLTTKTDEGDLLRLYDGIEVSAQGNTVKIDAKISPELVPKVVALLRGSVVRGMPGIPAE
jgi:hypothetical protein